MACNMALNYIYTYIAHYMHTQYHILCTTTSTHTNLDGVICQVVSDLADPGLVT